MKKAIDFYTGSLGFNVGLAFPDADNPEYVDLSKDGIVLMLIPAESHGISSEDKFGTGVYLYMNIDGYKLTFNQTSKTVKNCMSCGMPMSKLEDFGGGNPANVYCVHCSKPDGSLKSRDEVLAGMVNFMMMSQNMNRETARAAAKEHMAKMPAWGGG